jgi:hypothetical protein
MFAAGPCVDACAWALRGPMLTRFARVVPIGLAFWSQDEPAAAPDAKLRVVHLFDTLDSTCALPDFHLRPLRLPSLLAPPPRRRCRRHYETLRPQRLQAHGLPHRQPAQLVQWLAALSWPHPERLQAHELS